MYISPVGPRSGSSGNCILKVLKYLYLSQGLRAVQAAFQLHPTISKQEKLHNIEAVKKLFDSAGDTYRYLKFEWMSLPLSFRG